MEEPDVTETTLGKEHRYPENHADGVVAATVAAESVARRIRLAVMIRSLLATLENTHTSMTGSLGFIGDLERVVVGQARFLGCLSVKPWCTRSSWVVEIDASAWELYEDAALASIERVIAEMSVTLGTR